MYREEADGLQLIATDADDVLKHFKRGFVSYYNTTYDVALTERIVPGYMEIDQIKEEQLSRIDAIERVKRVHEDRASLDFEPREDALQVLPRLVAPETKLGFVIVTARQEEYAEITKQYIDKYFPGVFLDIYHTDLHPTDGSVPVEKFEVCRELGIKALIDDSPANCELAAASGMLAICFGDHPWNSHVSPQPNLVTLPDWYAVERFFIRPAKQLQ